MNTIFNKSVKDQKILTEQVRLIAQIQMPILGIMLLTGAALAYGLWDVTSRFALVVWMGVMLAAYLIRAFVYFRYIRHLNIDQPKWYILFVVSGAFVSGLIWGIGAVILFPSGQLEFQLIILVVLIGIGAGSLSTTTAYLPAFFAYFPVSILPISIKLFFESDSTHIILAYMALIFIIAMTYLSVKINRSFKKSLMLRFENIELLEQLRQQKGEADRANVAKSKFMAAASHDLRQPLHALTLFTSVLDELTEAPKAQRVVEKIKQSVHALQNLFNTLLDISCLDAGVMKVDKTGFYLQPMFERLANDFEPQANKKGIRIDWPHDSFSVYSDQNLLEQILNNYISNALRYTESGEIKINCVEEENEITISVMDSGCGIAIEDQETIFEEFHQLNNPERDRGKGLGLGLAIVQRTATLLGHSISVESQHGIGSIFSIDVEQIDDEQVKISKNSSETDNQNEVHIYSGENLLIVVIDDEVSIRDGMKNLLQLWNCDVVVATDKQEALSLLRQQERMPDGIISDYRLRENKTGIEVIQAIHAEYDTEIPALIVTGDIERDSLREVLISGYQVLHKPVAPLKLRTYLRHVQIGKKALAN